MALFDACKTLEAEKSLFNEGAVSVSFSTDESNNNVAGNEIRPLDPAMANVRYLPSKPDDEPAFTLVLDLDETLIHYRDGRQDDTQTEDESFGNESENIPTQTSKKREASQRVVTEEDEEVAFYIRPGLSAFLSELSRVYELVLWTAATREYADYFLKIIDHKCLFNGRILTREHCQFEGDYAIKDLRLLGRDLRKTIIVDNLAENFERTTPDNGI